MQQLPKGYYAVQSNFESAPKDSFTYKGVTYAVTEGENLFATLADANAKATEVPETVLEGLSYETFTTPVLLFSAGEHKIDKFSFDHSLTLLGQGAGINPNTPAADPMTTPTLTEARAEGESVLLGSFWYGYFTVGSIEASTIIVDGFSVTWSAICLSFIPVRSVIHSSLVSRILAKSSLVTTFFGM
jgi:hypothetical protein